MVEALKRLNGGAIHLPGRVKDHPDRVRLALRRSPEMPVFARYIGIDYSGAETPTASQKGLRVYMADRSSPPVEIMPPPSPRKYWTRRGVAEWLAEELAKDSPTIVGIDHGFSFPLRYFEVHALKPDWPPSSMIFSAIGRPMRTSTSISSVMARWETEPHAWATRAGGD
jgi:hypothetical protein